MKATLVAPLPKVNADVEFCQEGGADGRVCRYGARWADARPGQSPLRVHRTTAWDGQALAIGGGRRRVHIIRDAYDNLNGSVEK